jgi:glycosyltransferase involved in cell wall biosynthesis
MFLRKNGHSCAVINITRHRKADSDEVYYPNSAMQLVGLLRHLQYDVLHLHIGGMLTRRLLGLAFACTVMRRSKSVLSFHSGGYPSTPEAQATGPISLAGFVLRRFDGLIGVNSEILWFFRALGVPPERIRLIHPHAFLSDDGSLTELPEPLRSFYARHDPILISVGLLEPEYDLPLQIEALGEARKNSPCAGLVMIGSGSLEQALRSKIAVEPYGDHILLCGDVPHAATLQAIARARIMLRTTLYDGDSVAVHEALHLGTPVIATDNGMRPAGVKLIPKSSISMLLQSIDEELTTGALTRSVAPVTDQSNLKAVFDFYAELLEKQTR